MSVFFEDLRPGTVLELGPIDVSREEIVEFARRYDPQPFHIDEEAARSGPFGGLVASGWHTAALAMRVMVEAMGGAGSGSLGSPGVETLRWHAPVRPGDRLDLRVEVLEARPSESRPERGVVRFGVTATSQHGETVMTLVVLGLFLRRGSDREGS